MNAHRLVERRIPGIHGVSADRAFPLGLLPENLLLNSRAEV